MGACVRRLLAITAFLIVGAPLVSAGDFEAGAAQSVITPELSPERTVYLAGFGHNRTASGVHDDLYVRCLALGAANQKLVICSVDLIGLFYEDVLAIRQQFERLTPSALFLIVAATHTHAGPDTLGLYGPKVLETGVDAKYLSWVEGRIARTAADAVRAMQPALLELGRDDHPLLGLLQGEDRPPIVKDPFLFVMRLIARATGKTIAIAVNWSDHPEVLGEKEYRDYVGLPALGSCLSGKSTGRHGSVLFGFRGKGFSSQVSLVDPDTGRFAEDGTWLKKAELLGAEIGRLAERALKKRQADRHRTRSLTWM